ncbi:MAG: tetratricopeptide repeat protein, partial [Lentisphaerota bacterium]
YRMGSFSEAIDDYNKVLEINPDAADAWYGRGLAYFKKNDIKQALSDYNKVIEIRPEFPLAYSARAIAYFSKKDYVRTLSDINKAVALGFRMRPLKETSVEPLTAAAEKIEPSQSAEKALGKEQAWKERRRAARIKIYALTGLLIISLATILVLLIKSRKAKTARIDPSPKN